MTDSSHRTSKNSGISWIGTIPSNWTISTVKKEYPFFTGGTPNSSDDRLYDGENVWVNISDMKTKKISDSARHISDLGVKSAAIPISPKGSLLYSFKLSVGNVAFADVDLYTNEAIATFVDNGINSLRFFYYCAPISIIHNANTNIYGAFLLNKHSIANAKLAMPPIQEQEAIATFLDYYCDIVDTIICYQHEIISKLKDLKQSIISEAVTKGLDPDVPMKDSGIQWIGEIPESWDVLRLRQIGKCQNGVSKPGDYFGTGSPFVTYSDVYNSISFSKSSGQVNSDELDRITYSVKRGDVFFTRTSETVDEIGLTSVCTETIPEATFSGFLIRVRCNENLLYPEFAKYYFRSEVVRAFFIRETNLVTRASLSQDLLKNLPVFLPPMHIQIEIANYLDDICNKMDDLIFYYTSLNESILSLKRSLIYEYVTGKKSVPKEAI